MIFNKDAGKISKGKDSMFKKCCWEGEHWTVKSEIALLICKYAVSNTRESKTQHVLKNNNPRKQRENIVTLDSSDVLT